MDFPAALKERRASRRLSQLELAVRAGTTQRHLSFIENGRSAPGRDLVIRLTESLGLPLRDRNELLLLAGYAPAYPQTALDSPGLAPVLAALTHILDAHLPYPAIVIDRYGQIVAANASLAVLTDGCAEHLHSNAYRLALHPDGMAPRVANFAAWAGHVLNAMAAELARSAADVASSAGRKASSLSSATVTSTALAKVLMVVMRCSSPPGVRSSSGTAKPRWPGATWAGGT